MNMNMDPYPHLISPQNDDNMSHEQSSHQQQHGHNHPHHPLLPHPQQLPTQLVDLNHQNNHPGGHHPHHHHHHLGGNNPNPLNPGMLNLNNTLPATPAVGQQQQQHHQQQQQHQHHGNLPLPHHHHPMHIQLNPHQHPGTSSDPSGGSMSSFGSLGMNALNPNALNANGSETAPSTTTTIPIDDTIGQYPSHYEPIFERVFDSPESAYIALSDIAFQDNTHFTIRRSGKGAVNYICPFGGNYRPSKSLTKKSQHSTKKCECPVKINLNYSKRIQGWKFSRKSFIGFHNHNCDRTLPGLRRLSLTQTEWDDIERKIDDNVSIQVIYKELQSERPDVTIAIRDLYNFKKKLKQRREIESRQTVFGDGLSSPLSSVLQTSGGQLIDQYGNKLSTGLPLQHQQQLSHHHHHGHGPQSGSHPVFGSDDHHHNPLAGLPSIAELPGHGHGNQSSLLTTKHHQYGAQPALLAPNSLGQKSGTISAQKQQQNPQQQQQQQQQQGQQQGGNKQINNTTNGMNPQQQPQHLPPPSNYNPQQQQQQQQQQSNSQQQTPQQQSTQQQQPPQPQLPNPLAHLTQPLNLPPGAGQPLKSTLPQLPATQILHAIPSGALQLSLPTSLPTPILPAPAGGVQTAAPGGLLMRNNNPPPQQQPAATTAGSTGSTASHGSE